MNYDKEKKLFNAITELPEDLIDNVGDAHPGVPTYEGNISFVKVSWLQWAGFAAAFLIIVAAVIFVPNWSGESSVEKSPIVYDWEIRGLSTRDFTFDEIATHGSGGVHVSRAAVRNFKELFDEGYWLEIGKIAVIRADKVEVSEPNEYLMRKSSVTARVLLGISASHEGEIIAINQECYEQEWQKSNLLREGGVYIVVLTEQSDGCWIIGDMDVLFEIDENALIFSHSNNSEFNCFDGQHYSVLINAIVAIRAGNDTNLHAKISNQVLMERFDELWPQLGLKFVGTSVQHTYTSKVLNYPNRFFYNTELYLELYKTDYAMTSITGKGVFDKLGADDKSRLEAAVQIADAVIGFLHALDKDYEMAVRGLQDGGEAALSESHKYTRESIEHHVLNEVYWLSIWDWSPNGGDIQDEDYFTVGVYVSNHTPNLRSGITNRERTIGVMRQADGTFKVNVLYPHIIGPNDNYILADGGVQKDPAMKIALERELEVYGGQEGAVKSIEKTTRKDVEIWRVDIYNPHPGWSDDPYYRVDIDAKTGEIVKEYGLRIPEEPRLSKDKVKIICNSREYSVFENWNHGFSETFSRSGAPQEPWNLVDILPVIEYDSDFEIVFMGLDKNRGQASYRLYDEWFDDVYGGYGMKDSFEPPTERGTYYLMVSAWFYSNDRKSGNSYDFWVKIVVP